MMHYPPTTADILGSLPLAEQDELIALVAKAGAAGAAGWLAVPPAVWDALSRRHDEGGTP